MLRSLNTHQRGKGVSTKSILLHKSSEDYCIFNARRFFFVEIAPYHPDVMCDYHHDAVSVQLLWNGDDELSDC